MEILRQHDVFDRREVWHQMKLLEHETNLVRAKSREPRFIEPRDIRAVNDRLPCGG